MNCVVVKDFFGNLQVLVGRNGRRGWMLREGECALARALEAAKHGLAWDRREREREAARQAEWDAATKQVNIFGELELASTKRNPFTEAREAEDTRKGLVAK